MVRQPLNAKQDAHLHGLATKMTRACLYLCRRDAVRGIALLSCTGSGRQPWRSRVSCRHAQDHTERMHRQALVRRASAGDDPCTVSEQPVIRSCGRCLAIDCGLQCLHDALSTSEVDGGRVSK